MPVSRKTAELFEEGVMTLLEELQLAIQWGRPSILLAVAPLGKTRQRAQDELAARLGRLGQGIEHFRVGVRKHDVVLEVLNLPRREKTVFYVSGVGRGGGQQGQNAYKSLNIRRELLVDHKIRMVLWLTPAEALALPARAPDFWAFRHRVVEFGRMRRLL